MNRTERFHIHVNAASPHLSPRAQKGYKHNSRTGELCVFFSTYILKTCTARDCLILCLSKATMNTEAETRTLV